MKISPENVLGTLMFSRQHNFNELELWCWDYIEYNFASVCIEKEFVFMALEDLVQLLASNKLNIRTEIEACNAMIRWVHHQLEERKGQLETLFRVLRHSQLKMELIEKCPKKFQVHKRQEQK